MALQGVATASKYQEQLKEAQAEGSFTAFSCCADWTLHLVNQLWPGLRLCLYARIFFASPSL
jgi:hypothetical protein